MGWQKGKKQSAASNRRRRAVWTAARRKAESSRKRVFYSTPQGKKVKREISRKSRLSSKRNPRGFAVWSTSRRSRTMKKVWGRSGHEEKVRGTRLKNGGWSPSEETRRKISRTLIGRPKPKRTLEHRRNLSLSLRKPSTRRLLAEKIAKARTKQAKPNKLEKKLYVLLKKYFPNQFRINVRNGVVIGGKIPDFIHTKKKVIVELFGVYWHTEHRGISKRVAEDERKRHLKKFGYRVLIIWSNLLKKSPVAVVSKIRRFLWKSPN